MSKNKLKTLKNKASVVAYIAKIKDKEKRRDATQLLKLFKSATKQKPIMWGDSIVGFGSYYYKSTRSAQEGEWPLTGFSARKQNLTVYLMNGFEEYKTLLKKLGKSKTAKSCLYIKRLSDIDLPTLRIMVDKSYRTVKKRYSKKVNLI